MDTFTADERARLAPFFTNLDGPVFALRNLPEVVKGALFARYSRSPKSLRRLFLDEFLGADGGVHVPEATVGSDRAETLYQRVFLEYGDDSVAQLGGAHLACEGVSNILTKQLEWGRLMAYLEQSTRYIPFDDRPGGRYRYHVPAELGGALREQFIGTTDLAFDTYRESLPRMVAYVTETYPRAAEVSPAAYAASVRAKATDTLRPLLPAATTSNVGIFGSAQAYEALLLRLFASPYAEARSYAALILTELRKVIPAFLTRVDLPDRGVAWSIYLRETRERVRAVARTVLTASVTSASPAPEVVLSDFDPEGEVKVVAAALYAVSDLPDGALLDRVRAMTPAQRAAVLQAYTGDRQTRRHKPGRAFERASYRFDVLADYGVFRDLQRHRMCAIEWQPLTPDHGYVTPPAIIEAGLQGSWDRVMEASAALFHAIASAGLPDVASYAVVLAYRVRFYMEMNARAAMHMLELRTAPQGHPSYRRICQEMHRQIAQTAGHHGIAAAMRFVDYSTPGLERLAAEQRAEQKRAAASAS